LSASIASIERGTNLSEVLTHLVTEVNAHVELLNRSFFLHRIVPVCIGHFGEQAGDRRHDAPGRVVRIGEILLDDLREALARLGGHFFRCVIAAEDHRGLNIPAAADAQGS